ncbi:MAG: ABC transporter ATP-binding protein [Bacteroidia bacterium]|nr:ABC transporter ATP-binding protein [Bacteroidia bacterium]
MLEAKNIWKSYGKVEVLKGVSLSLEQGEVVALVGSSGAGKSTLLQILGTLDDADQGEIFFESQNIKQLSKDAKAHFRNKSLGFIFQFHHLLPEFTALENVAMPALIKGLSLQEAGLFATELLGKLGLEDRIHHKPSQLSGGEQQRVSVARALMNRPKLVLADEPTGNLDTQNSESLYQLFLNLAREFGVGFLIATHNTALAAQSDRVLYIKDGLMQQA